MLAQLKKLSGGIAGKEFIAEIDELQAKLKSEKLYIVVLGLFKRGRSSLINVILEKDLLPVSVIPVTAIVTILESTSGKPRMEVQFTDGHYEEMAPDQVCFYVSEEENPANEKMVEVIRIYDTAPLLKTVSLVDTPGLGSAFEHNTNTTLRFIPKIDVAIFVSSADMPVSRLDMNFLGDLKKSVSKILFVINKIDLLNESDLKKMIAHNLKIISGVLERTMLENEMFLISARQPHLCPQGTGISRLVQKIRDIAASEKSALLQQSAGRQYRRLHNQLQMQLHLKLDTLMMPLHELEEKQMSLKTSISLMQTQKDEFESIIIGKIRLLQEQIHHLMNEESKSVKATVNKKLIETGDSIWRNEQFERIQTELNQFILSRFELTKETLEQSVREQFKNLLGQFSSRSQSFLNKLANHLKALMGISFDMISDKFDLNVYTSFYLSLDSGTGNVQFNHSIFSQLLTASSRRKRALNRLEKHFHAIIIRNTASVIYDLQYKIQESFRKFSYDLNNRLKELLESIEAIIAGTISAKNQKEYLIDDEVRNVKKKLTLLNSIGSTDNEMIELKQ